MLMFKRAERPRHKQSCLALAPLECEVVEAKQATMFARAKLPLTDVTAVAPFLTTFRLGAGRCPPMLERCVAIAATKAYETGTTYVRQLSSLAPDVLRDATRARRRLAKLRKL